MSLAFKHAAASNIGRVRKTNQDSGYAGRHLLVLADGMGGAAAGDLASAIAIDHLRRFDRVRGDALDEHGLEHLEKAVREAHMELCDRAALDPRLEGLGTTCIALHADGAELSLIHVGDSRAYRLRGTHFSQITTDHSFVQYLLDSGQITPEQAENHPQRSVLLRVLGDSMEDVKLDTSHPDWQLGDRWLLCSDGLCGVVSGETIGTILYQEQDLQVACNKLVDLALAAGGPDNITVVIAEITEDPEENQPVQIVGAAATEHLQTVREEQNKLLKMLSASQTLAQNAAQSPAAPHMPTSPITPSEGQTETLPALSPSDVETTGEMKAVAGASPLPESTPPDSYKGPKQAEGASASLIAGDQAIIPVTEHKSETKNLDFVPSDEPLTQANFQRDPKKWGVSVVLQDASGTTAKERSEQEKALYEAKAAAVRKSHRGLSGKAKAFLTVFVLLLFVGGLGSASYLSTYQEGWVLNASKSTQEATVHLSRDSGSSEETPDFTYVYFDRKTSFKLFWLWNINWTGQETKFTCSSISNRGGYVKNRNELSYDGCSYLRTNSENGKIYPTNAALQQAANDAQEQASTVPNSLSSSSFDRSEQDNPTLDQERTFEKQLQDGSSPEGN